MPPISSDHPISIVIADDHLIFRKGLITALQGHSSFYIAGEASTGKKLLELVENLQPDIVITDIQMPEMNGYEATALINQRFPKTSVLALSMSDTKHTVNKMLRVGAKAFLPKTADPDEIVSAIMAIHKYDNCCFTSTNSAQVSFTHPRALYEQPLFTCKELTVIDLICQQYSNKEIASKTGCTTRSVESAKERIQNKTGAKNMVGIVLFAIKNSLFCIE